MFKRRRKRTLAESAREWIWPKSGWNRLVRYYSYRLARIPDTTYKISAGLACGAAVSFTPFLGFHLLGAVLMAYILRANLLAGAIGTAIGNPWTFPFIWVLIYQVGAVVTGDVATRNLDQIVDVERLIGDPLDAFSGALWPMVVGGLLTIPVVWWVTYFVAKFLIERYRHRRSRKLAVRRKALSQLRREGEI